MTSASEIVQRPSEDFTCEEPFRILVRVYRHGMARSRLGVPFVYAQLTNWTKAWKAYFPCEGTNSPISLANGTAISARVRLSKQLNADSVLFVEHLAPAK